MIVPVTSCQGLTSMLTLSIVEVMLEPFGAFSSFVQEASIKIEQIKTTAKPHNGLCSRKVWLDNDLSNWLIFNELPPLSGRYAFDGVSWRVVFDWICKDTKKEQNSNNNVKNEKDKKIKW